MKKQHLNFLEVLTLLLIGLKLTDNIHSSWWVVMSPMIVYFILIILMVILKKILEK